MKNAPNLKDMLFKDARREEFWKRVRNQLALWARQDLYVLDVACGYGQFAGLFTPSQYEGADFCQGMIDEAERQHPLHRFQRVDVKEGLDLSGTLLLDVIFEVNSLKSLGMSADEFITKFQPYATHAIACLESDRFTIAHVY